MKDPYFLNFFGANNFPPLNFFTVSKSTLVRQTFFNITGSLKKKTINNHFMGKLKINNLRVFLIERMKTLNLKRLFLAFLAEKGKRMGPKSLPNQSAFISILKCIGTNI